MSAAETRREDLLEKLRRPFNPDEIEKLPKVLSKDDRNRDRCQRGSRVSADGHYCGGWHARAMHLDYVGHAGITDRLNEVDPGWDYEFMHVELPPWAGAAVASLYEAGTPDALAEARRLVRSHGRPLSQDGGYWIRLTVLGITRMGFGDAAGKSGANATKEVIGDALRNAAMRFGVGTYLWSKSEAAEAKRLGVEDPDGQEAAPEPGQEPEEAPMQQRDDPRAVFTQSLERARGDLQKLTGLRQWVEGKNFPAEAIEAVDKYIAELETPQ